MSFFPPVTLTARSLQALSANGIVLTIGGKPLANVNSKVLLDLKLLKHNLLDGGPKIDRKQAIKNVIALGRGTTPRELHDIGVSNVDLLDPFNNLKKVDSDRWSGRLSDAFSHYLFDAPGIPKNEYSDKLRAFSMLAGFARTNDDKSYVVKVLMDVMKKHDKSTALHMQETAKWAVAIAKEMGLSDDEVWQVQVATLLHDIGKLGVKKEVLDKLGDLNKDDVFRLHELHVILGYDILRHISWFTKDMLDIVLYHHYLQGYPEGLDFHNISLMVKIVAVADSYDAATGGRVYQAKITPQQMMAELESCKRTVKGKEVIVNYDKTVVAAFRRVLEREKII